MRANAAPYDWAVRFSDRIQKRALTEHDHGKRRSATSRSAKTRACRRPPEHYLPLLYVGAQQAEGEALTLFNDRVESSISMLGFKVG